MPPIRYKDTPQIPESTYALDIAKIVNSVEQTVKASYDKEKKGRAVRFAQAKSYGIVRAPEIMTVRREVYRRSAELRRRINKQPQREPSSANDVFDLGQRAA